MGSLFLEDLADVVRKAMPFVTDVIEVDGWKKRARGSGGYPGRVKGVSHHHDAGNPLSDGWPSVNYETFISPAKPITNLHLDRKGRVWVCAAGATNTIGAGGPMGDFLLNEGNAWQLGIEAGNNGLGERWPDVQVRAYIELDAVLWLGYGIAMSWHLPLHPDQFFDHRRWAPGRKIDRKGHAECVFNGARIVFAEGYSYWDTGLYYGTVSQRIDELQHPIVIDPQPPVFLPEEDDMTTITRWDGEPFDIEVSAPKPGTLQRVWRGIDPNDAGKLIAAGLAWDHRGDPLPLSLKGDFNAAAPQYQRVG